jgi:flagellar M-ring protein FliF
VLVDESRVVKGGKSTAIPRTKEELAALEDIVKKAVGFDANRGDSLTVQSLAFHHDDMSDATKLSEPPFWRRYIPFAILAVVVMVAFIVLSFRSRGDRKLSAARRAAELKAAERAGIGLPGAADPHSLPETLQQRLLEPAKSSIDYRAKALEVAGRDPATASLVLKSWLAEGSAPAAEPTKA